MHFQCTIRPGAWLGNVSIMTQLLLPSELLHDLAQVEQVVRARIQSHAAVMAIAGPHVLGTGEVRLRAALTLLAAQLGRYSLAAVIHAAAAVELIHTASLVHDELVDEAEQRRGATPDDAEWDHGVALMVGDYFFALSAGEMALSPDPRIITYFAHAVMTICEGELAPVMGATPLETALEQYYYKIGCKTGALFAAACKAGMASGGGSDEEIMQLGRFGYDLGLACQVMEDIRDFGEPEAVSGTPVGSSLRKGIITLPLIYAVELGGGADLAGVIDTHDTAHLAWGITQVQRLGIEPARAEARRLVERALTHLAGFPESLGLRTLGDITDFVLEQG